MVNVRINTFPQWSDITKRKSLRVQNELVATFYLCLRFSPFSLALGLVIVAIHKQQRRVLAVLKKLSFISSRCTAPLKT